eukprot:m.249156 g.249156  ORF g.249156 m.249156 type:complete len:665 (+) comp16140_c1_seq6:1434-3428(+)
MLAGSAGYNSLIHAPSSAGSCSTTTTSSTSTSTVTTTTTSSTSSFTTSTVTSTTSSITSSTSTTSSITTATSTTTSVSTSTVSSVTSSSTTVSSVTSTTLTTMTTTGCRLVQAAEYHNEISVRALANGESAKLTWYLPGYHALSTQDVRVDVITFGTNTIFEDPHVEYELGANVSARVILYLIQLTANNNADEEYLPVRLQVSAFIPAGVSRPDFEWVTDLEYFSTPSEIQLKKYIETNKTISLLENDLEMLDQLNKTAGQGDGDSNSNKLIINLEEGEAAETQTKASHSCYDYTLIIVLLCLFFLLCCCCPLLFVIWWLRRKQEEEESELDEGSWSKHRRRMTGIPMDKQEPRTSISGISFDQGSEGGIDFMPGRSRPRVSFPQIHVPAELRSASPLTPSSPLAVSASAPPTLEDIQRETMANLRRDSRLLQQPPSVAYGLDNVDDVISNQDEDSVMETKEAAPRRKTMLRPLTLYDDNDSDMMDSNALYTGDTGDTGDNIGLPPMSPGIYENNETLKPSLAVHEWNSSASSETDDIVPNPDANLDTAAGRDYLEPVVDDTPRYIDVTNATSYKNDDLVAGDEQEQEQQQQEQEQEQVQEKVQEAADEEVEEEDDDDDYDNNDETESNEEGDEMTTLKRINKRGKVRSIVRRLSATDIVPGNT